MTNLTTVTNSQVSTAASAVPAPFGPLTRVTDVELTPRTVPNTRTKFEFYITALGTNSTHVWLTYEELMDLRTVETIMRQTFGVQYLFYELQKVIGGLWYRIEGVDPFTVDAVDYQDAMVQVQYYKNFQAMTPVFDWVEVSRNNPNRANFTLSGTGASRTLTNTSTGYHIDHFTIDWGDGTDPVKSDTLTTSSHTYTADGTYIVTLYISGHGGPDAKSTSIVVDVP